MAANRSETKETNVEKGRGNFRYQEDVEAFYRFVFNHDLRHEAKVLLSKVIAAQKPSRSRSKKSLH